MTELLKTFKSCLIQIYWNLPTVWLFSGPRGSIETLPTNRRSDIQYWRATAGYTIATFLHEAGYSLAVQQRHLAFFNSTLAPELGCKPRPGFLHGQWQSFMTDDGTPVEVSWDWGFDCNQAIIRYSIEPVGSEAGSSHDPLNQYAGSRFMESMHELLPGADWQWSEHFRKEFCIFPKSSEPDNDEAHQSRFFAAFDLDGSIVTMKAYYFPAFKAKHIKQPKIEVLASAIARLPNCKPSDFSAFDLLQNYINSTPSRSAGSLDIEILAVDCVHPQKSRLKVYARARQISFESVCTIVTLGGRLESSEMNQSLQELDILWRYLFSDDISSSDVPAGAVPSLSLNSHRTAGILYNFEIKPGCPLPVPKVYIPVRHNARSDSRVMQALRNYIEGSRHEGTALFARYSKAMRKLFPADDSWHDRGLHTYIGCTLKGGSLRLVSYINPQVHKMSWNEK